MISPVRKAMMGMEKPIKMELTVPITINATSKLVEKRKRDRRPFLECFSWFSEGWENSGSSSARLYSSMLMYKIQSRIIPLVLSTALFEKCFALEKT